MSMAVTILLIYDDQRIFICHQPLHNLDSLSFCLSESRLHSQLLNSEWLEILISRFPVSMPLYLSLSLLCAHTVFINFPVFALSSQLSLPGCHPMSFASKFLSSNNVTNLRRPVCDAQFPENQFFIRTLSVWLLSANRRSFGRWAARFIWCSRAWKFSVFQTVRFFFFVTLLLWMI